MNILILNWRDISHPLSGGAEIVTHEHAKAWVKRGHTVTWFTSWYSPAKREEDVDGIKMIRRAGSLTVYPAGMTYVLFHSHEFDVIVDEVHGFPFFSTLFTRKPVVVFIHEIAGVIWDFMYPFPINVIGKFIESWYFRLYQNYQFWTVSPSTVEELVARGIPREQCTAILNPIIHDETWDNDPPASAMLKALRAGQQQVIRKQKNPTYIFVSRVVKMKGIEEVIKAFSFIVRVQNNAQLWIVGGGEASYIEELKNMINEYGVGKNVVFFGKVSEQKKFELMARSHILLHASVKEGWGLVVPEAASVGTPSVVYDVPGLRDVVKNGKTGTVLSENSPKEMAKEAMLLIQNTNLYRKLQSQGLEWVKSLKWSTVTKQSAKLLEKAITSSHKYS